MPAGATAAAAVALILILPPPTAAQPPPLKPDANKTNGGNASFVYRPDYIGGFQPFDAVVRRRREDYVECRYNGTLTSRGVGVAVALPDVGRLTFAFAAPSRTRAAVVGVNATDRVADALAAAGFSLAAGPLGGGSATATIDMSPIKYALPVPEGDNADKAAYLVETRVELRAPDPAMLEDAYSRALEAAVASGRNGSFRAAGATYELSRPRIDELFEEARQAAVRDMLTNLIRYAADLGVALGPLDAAAPERRGEIATGPDDDDASELVSEGGGRPARLFGLVEVAADYQVCSGGFVQRTRWICIDEQGIDIECPASSGRWAGGV